METKKDIAKKVARAPKSVKIDIPKSENMEKPKRHRRSRSGKPIVPCTDVATILEVRDPLN